MKTKHILQILVILINVNVLGQSQHYKISFSSFESNSPILDSQTLLASVIPFEQSNSKFQIKCYTSYVQIIRIQTELMDSIKFEYKSRFDYMYININECGMLDIIELSKVTDSVKYVALVYIIDLNKMKEVEYGYRSEHISNILIDSLGTLKSIPTFDSEGSFFNLYTTGIVNENINIDSIVAFEPLYILASCMDDAEILLNPTGYSYYFDATKFFIVPFRKYVFNDSTTAIFQLIYFEDFSFSSLSVALIDTDGSIIRTHTIGQTNPLSKDLSLRLFYEYRIDENKILYLNDNKGGSIMDLTKF